MGGFTHFDEQGRSRMVDVAPKPVSQRTARASGAVRMLPATLRAITEGQVSKGDVLEVARLAGVMAAKRTAELVPLCHTVPLESVHVAFAAIGDDRLGIEAVASATAKTGVEMEAIVAASIAAITVYDMCKAVDRAMTIERIQLEEKSGGSSGHYHRDAKES